MKIGLVTIFPKMFDSLKYGVIGRALENRLLTLSFWNPRDYTSDTNTVDDRPYGGGPGMVMKFEPLQAALTAAKLALGQTTKVIYLSPQGELLTQATIAEKASSSSVFILVAGRYEGIDERLIEAEIDEEWSIGDYIVSGGELPAMIFIDAITRLIPGALGHKDSAYQDSFTSGLLDFPHYTRPKKIANHSVPSVLLSGNHAAIAQWRLKKSIGRTWQKRSDLLQRHSLTKNEQRLLDEFIRE